MDNIIIVLGLIVIISAVAIGVCFFLKLEKEKQLQLVKEWLLLAVVKAERELGSGTGQLKLRFVYDMFMDKFKLLSHLISFEYFSYLVDSSLILMREMISENVKVASYINDNK